MQVDFCSVKMTRHYLWNTFAGWRWNLFYPNQPCVFLPTVTFCFYEFVQINTYNLF